MTSVDAWELCARVADAEAERWLQVLQNRGHTIAASNALAARILTARHIAEQIRLLPKAKEPADGTE